MFHKSKNRALAALLVSDSLYFASLAMYTPIFALFVQRINGGVIAASSAWSIMTFTTGITIYCIRSFGEKIKEGELLVSLGYLLAAISFWLLIFVQSVAWLYAVVVVLGIAHGIRAPMFDATYSKHLDKGQYVRQWGDWEVLFNVVSGFGALLGGLLVANFGFVVIFALMGLFSFVSSVYIYIQPRKLL